MTVKSGTTSSSHSDRAHAAHAPKTVPPWLRKAGTFTAKVALFGTAAAAVVFGNLLGDGTPANKMPQWKVPEAAAMFERAKSVFETKIAWAQEMTLEEALALLKSPVETQEAGAYSVPASSYTSILNEGQKRKLKELQKEGKDLYLSTVPFVMRYRGIDVAFGVNWETKLVIGLGTDETQFVDLTAIKNFRDYFRGKSVDPETLSKLSKYTKIVGFDAYKKGVTGILIADRGDESVLFLTVEITGESVNVNGMTIELGFKLSDNFDMSVVTAKGTDYGAVVLYDSAMRDGWIYPWAPQPLPPIAYWPEDGASPTFEQVKVVPIMQGTRNLMGIQDPQGIIVLEYVSEENAMRRLYEGPLLAMK